MDGGWLAGDRNLTLYFCKEIAEEGNVHKVEAEDEDFFFKCPKESGEIGGPWHSGNSMESLR